MSLAAEAVAGARASLTQVAAWLLLVAAVAAISLAGWGTFQVGVYQDDAVYALLARAIAEGDRYGVLADPANPMPAKYPFGLPLLLAPLQLWWPDDPTAMTAVPLAATLANVSLLFWAWPWLGPTTSRWWGLGVASLHGLSPLAIDHSRMVMSEPTFLTFTLLSLILAEVLARGRHRSPALPFLLGVALVFAFFTRYVGAAVGLAAVVRILHARRSKALPVLAWVGLGAVTTLAAVLLLTPVELGGMAPRQYLGEIEQSVAPAEAVSAQARWQRVRRVLSGYVRSDIWRATIPIGIGARGRAWAERLEVTWLSDSLGIVVTALVAFGFVAAARARALAPSVLGYQVVYLVGVQFWPWSGVRYLYPLQPFLYFQILFAVASLASLGAAGRATGGLRANRRGPMAASIGWAGLAVILVWKSVQIAGSIGHTRDFRLGTTWLRQNAPAAAVVVARYPSQVHLYSRRTTLPLVGGPDRLAQILDQRSVDYVLVGPELKWRMDGEFDYDGATRDEIVPWLEAQRARGTMTLVYESLPNERVRVYRVERSGEG